MLLALAGSGVFAQEEAERFSISEYRVLGNSVLSGVEIEQRLYPLLGEDKSIADVEAARQSLETLYRDRGFGTVLVDIPEQQVDDGVVRFQVTEGKLDRVRISGARYFSNRRIRQALPALASDSVPFLPDVQAQLAQLNRGSADRSVVPVLRAGRMPGTVDVELKVADELPFHGGVEVNDRYTSDTTRWRANISLSYGNLFQREHTLSFQYQTAPEERSDVEAFVASYVFRVPDWNTAFAVYGVKSETDVAALGALSVLGAGEIVGLRAIRALPESDSNFHNLTLGLDYKDFEENIRLDRDQELKTPIRYMNWSLVYAGTQRGESGVNGYSLGANFGVRKLVNSSEEFAEKRGQGNANYFYVRGALERTQRLTDRWQLFGKVTGQFTPDPLISNEQLSIGGADSVRGYLESAQLGDYGAVGSVEVRNHLLAKWLSTPPSGTYLFAFYDSGIVRIQHSPPGQTAQFDLSSTGLGVRVGEWYGMNIAADWAQALNSSGRVQSGDDRVHISIGYKF